MKGAQLLTRNLLKVSTLKCLWAALFVLIVIGWEEHAFQARQQGNSSNVIPSEFLDKWMRVIGNVFYNAGLWVARFCNPLYYLRRLIPWRDACMRLITGVFYNFPPLCFLHGFYAEPVYGVTFTLYMLDISYKLSPQLTARVVAFFMSVVAFIANATLD